MNACGVPDRFNFPQIRAANVAAMFGPEILVFIFAAAFALLAVTLGYYWLRG